MSIVTTEEQYQGFSQLVQQIFACVPEAFLLKAEESALVAKRLKQQSASSNKYQQALVCQVFFEYLKRFSGSRAEFAEVGKALDQIYVSVYQANLKDNKKLVSNSLMLLQSLATVTLGYKHLSAGNQAELAKSCSQLLSPGNYFNQEEFFVRCAPREKTLLFICYSQILKLFGADIAAQGGSPFVLLAKVWLHAYLLAERVNEHFQWQFQPEHSPPALLDAICLALFVYAYFICDMLPPEKQFQAKKIQQLLKFVLKSLPALKEGSGQLQHIDKVLYVLYHPQFSSKKIQLRYVRLVHKHAEAKAFLLAAFRKSRLNSGYCLIGENFLKNARASVA